MPANTHVCSYKTQQCLNRDCHSSSRSRLCSRSHSCFKYCSPSWSHSHSSRKVCRCCRFLLSFSPVITFTSDGSTLILTEAIPSNIPKAPFKLKALTTPAHSATIIASGIAVSHRHDNACKLWLRLLAEARSRWKRLLAEPCTWECQSQFLTKCNWCRPHLPIPAIFLLEVCHLRPIPMSFPLHVVCVALFY